MQDLLNQFAQPKLTAPIIITLNSSDCGGLHFMQHTRLLIFSKSEGYLHIDLNPVPISCDWVYIIPALHFHYYRSDYPGDVMCIDLDDRSLNSDQKRIIYSYKYQDQGGPLPRRIAASHYSIAIEEVASLPGPNAQIDFINNWMNKAHTPTNMRGSDEKNDRYLKTAERFLEELKTRKLSLTSCSVQNIADALSCSERTLLRNCMLAFGKPVKDIVKYHVMVKAAYLLLTGKYTVIKIAKELGFSSVNSFDKYFKRVTGQTPTELKSVLTSAMK